MGGLQLVLSKTNRSDHTKGHFTHETESPWTVTLQALSLVEKVEPVQVRFTLRLQDQESR